MSVELIALFPGSPHYPHTCGRESNVYLSRNMFTCTWWGEFGTRNGTRLHVCTAALCALFPCVNYIRVVSSTYTCTCTCWWKMQKEGGKKQARSYKQQSKAKQSTQGSHFSKEKWAASGGIQTHNTLHSRQSALPTELPMYMLFCLCCSFWDLPVTCTCSSVHECR